jgi:opacity protein-like surface antigen
MKNILFLFLVATVSTTSVADEKKGYFEFGIGKSSVDVSTKTYSGSAGGVTYTNAKADFDYKDPTTYGFEIGISNFLSTPLRIGFAVATLDLELEKATGTGTIATGSGTVTLSGSATAADFRGIGVSFDNDVKIYMVNGYYDFASEGKIRPFIGAGVGLADVQNAKDREFTLGLHAGINYDLGNNMYVGGRFSNYQINGITDKLGVQYEDTSVNYYGITIGVRF